MVIVKFSSEPQPGRMYKAIAYAGMEAIIQAISD
jgi:hypothetical protein